MEFETILLQKEGAIGYLSLNRIQQRNAINTKMLQEIGEVCSALDQDDNIRAIVIKSACEGVFSAGADLKERKGMTDKEIKNRRSLARDTYELLQRIEKPLICAVNGKTFGGGFEIASSCDFIISSENASFCLPEVRWGTLGATQRLTRLVGKNLAKYYLLTAKVISGEEAYRIGLTAELVSEEDFERVVKETVEKISTYSPLATRLSKKCVDVGVELDMVSATNFEMQAVETLIASKHWEQGVNEFLTQKESRVKP